ncbi:hypothetical protein MIMGU_mgv1a011468mg [Erythranthe guttata]|uniref:SNARE associated Golgi protein family n=1 Tax=Erythranthe guttata TaxID=4155 RepID=A0A022RNP3_ERYGU|nr:hypothetical protein MIMGU_mgv1a011468mg [Erythranthe guttata]
MTYNAAGDEDLRMDREYVKLEGGGGDGSPPCAAAVASRYCGDGCGLGRRSLWWWGKLLLLVVFAGLFAAVIFKWVGPFLMDKGIIPIINWEMKTFSKTKLALVVFGSLTIFPSLLLPSSPSMWVAGMTFGYVYGFLLVIGAVAIGVSVPYFIGSLFYHKIQVWLDRYPKKASVIRLAGEGDSFNQFRAVAFIRISPFPYIWHLHKNVGRCFIRSAVFDSFSDNIKPSWLWHYCYNNSNCHVVRQTKVEGTEDGRGSSVKVIACFSYRASNGNYEFLSIYT